MADSPLAASRDDQPCHYHLRLYYSGQILKELERLDSSRDALARARDLTSRVQRHMGAGTYRVRAEPCTLLHFPEHRAARQ